jgi:serine/threonine protein kinase
MGSLLGRRINNFELRSVLGQGGMGVVYVAEHPVIGRKVAIKVLHAELARDQRLVKRFINEARAANAIRHDHIVEILDVGTLEDGLPYLVMELLEGETLSARLRREGRLPPEQAVELALQVASALAATHAAGIVHRDLKPDNLFLAADPTGQSRVKVLDFGVAKLRGDLVGGSDHTNSGALLGTPRYMSPEQCLGRTGEVDHRADVYSLGAILFELVCGQPPFTGQGFGEVLMMQMSTPPPNPRALNPAISPSLEWTILKALAKRKQDRFATIDELARALRGEVVAPVAAPPLAALATLARQPGTTTLSSSNGVLGERTAASGPWFRGGLLVLALVVPLVAVVVYRLGGTHPLWRGRRPAALTPAATAAPIPSDVTRPPPPTSVPEPAVAPVVSPALEPAREEPPPRPGRSRRTGTGPHRHAVTPGPRPPAVSPVAPEPPQPEAKPKYRLEKL